MPRAASVSVKTAAALLALATLAGCGGGGLTGRDAAIRNNLTPELVTLDERPADYANTRALTVNTNLRLLADDWRRFWYMNRPSHLTRYPVIR